MKTQTASNRTAPRSLILLAFLAIYLVWGSTYLGIRFAVETLPPFFMGGARFLIAGSVLYLWLRFRGTPAPDRSTWKSAAIAALFLLGIGNGAVNWAEQKVPSSLAALIIAGTPLWFATFEWLRPQGTRPTLRTVVGILIGFVGVAILVTANRGVTGGASLAGVIALLVASMSWAGGSLYAKYSAPPTSTMMTAAQQMLTGGAILLASGIVLGELNGFHWAQVSTRSLLAFGYLSLVGSLVGFTAYAWLLKVSTPAKVSTYAYVNPVIAVLLGWAIGGETLTGSMLLAAAIVVAAVIVLTTRPALRAQLNSTTNTDVPEKARPITAAVLSTSKR